MTDKRHHHLSGYHSSAFRHPIPGYMGLSDPRGPFENSAAASKKAALFGKRYSHDEELKARRPWEYQKELRVPERNLLQNLYTSPPELRPLNRVPELGQLPGFSIAYPASTARRCFHRSLPF